MRGIFRLVCVSALGLLPLIGCGEDGGDGGSGGTAGTGGMAGTGGSTGEVFPCTEQGIRDAIAEGNGPHTFDCDGPTTVVTEAEIIIDNDVILDGERNLTVDGNDGHPVFVLRPTFVPPGSTVELRGFTITRGKNVQEECFPEPWRCAGGGIYNGGTLTLIDSTVASNTAFSGGGIYNTPSEAYVSSGTLTLINSTVRNNSAGPEHAGGGIYNGGTVTLIDTALTSNTAGSDGGGVLNISEATATLTGCTVSGNAVTSPGYGGGGAISNGGTLTLINSTVSENSSPIAGAMGNIGTLTLINSTITRNTTEQGADVRTEGGPVTIRSSLIDGDCSDLASGAPDIMSLGRNIESPGDTCGFDQATDQAEITAEALALGPLQDNRGPTMTHALLSGSVAIDKIPEAECVDADGAPLTTDQRGVTRPQGPACDVGAFELEVAP